jgi:hypothetical protein
VLDVAQGPNRGDLSRQQGAAALSGHATRLRQGLATFIVSLQIDCPSHEGRVQHAKIHSMYEYDLVWPVEQSDLFHGSKGFVRPIYAD